MSRMQNHLGDRACWSVDRENPWTDQPAERFFDDVKQGRHCLGTDWYEGSTTGNRGHFKLDLKAAPALLGFDNDIASFCVGNCDDAGFNILNMFGHIPYNMCRNFEWQVCAALGMLPRQNTRVTRFAWPPATLSMDLSEGVFGTCSGYTDRPCQTPWVGFANDDVYYLEVCLYAQICSNSDRLFKIKRGDSFICHLDGASFAELQDWLVSGPSVGPRQG